MQVRFLANLAPLPALPEQMPERTVRIDRQWHGGRVLVAEDNILLAEVICDFLRECGLEPVGPATTIGDAVAAAQDEPIDGAVLDLRLGRHFCFPACSTLMARRVPFLFLTGYGDLSMIPVELRAVPLICKPFDSAEMKSALATMLRLDDDWSVLPGRLRN
ncbi:MAG: response regulator [Reyranellaceae bacterium]